MPAIIECECGAKLRTYEQHAGQIITCPRCGAGINVPGATAIPAAVAARLSETELNAPFEPIGDDEAASSSRLPIIAGVASFGAGVLVTLLGVYLLSPAPGAKPAAEPGVRGTERAKRPAIPLEFPLARKFQHDFEVKREQNKFDDYISFTAHTEGQDHAPKLNAYFLANQASGKSYENVTLSFTLVSAGWQFLKYHPVKFLLDGQKLDPGESEHSGDILSGGDVIEYVRVSLDLPTFQKLIQAGQVDVQVGTVEFALTPQQLEALRHLSSLIPPGETDEGKYVISHK